MAHAYPILVDLAGKLVVIVGGGKVAVRKARGVIEGGGTKIRCVAPKIDPDMQEQVERVERKFEPTDLGGAALVFAATDLAAVNSAVVRAARERGILVCRADADEEDAGDFAVPAVWRNGALILSVAAASPALSAALRDAIAKNAPSMERYKHMAEVLRTLRPKLRSLGSLTPLRRRAALVDLASPAALDELSRHGNEGLWQWLVSRYPELKGEKAP